MEQPDLLRFVTDVLARLQVPYMLVGSYGSSLHGEPRFTHDIDIVCELPADRITAFCAAFPAEEFYISPDAVRQAVQSRHQFTIQHLPTGFKIDCMLPQRTPWGLSQLGRRREVELEPGFRVFVASPEDVILGKLWYYAEGGSEKHLRDIVGILKRGGDCVNVAKLTHWAELLGYTTIWEAVLQRRDESPPS